jgi:hypothetical protein
MRGGGVRLYVLDTSVVLKVMGGRFVTADDKLLRKLKRQPYALALSTLPHEPQRPDLGTASR